MSERLFCGTSVIVADLRAGMEGKPLSRASLSVLLYERRTKYKKYTT